MQLRRLGLALFAVLFVAFPAAAEDKVFFGNLHSHTSYSDGSGTPADAFRHARLVARLDFLAITEHNHKSAENGAKQDRRDGLLIARNPRLYHGKGPNGAIDPDALIPTAKERTEDGKFVAIYGQEFSSIGIGNHVNVFDVPDVINVKSGRFDTLVNEWLPAHKDTTGKLPILQFNHPALLDDNSVEYGRDDFASFNEWRKKIDSVAQLIEIVNGPAMTKDSGKKPAEVMEADYKYYLNLGFHLAPTANQDNHYFTWGTATNARTGVIAEKLSKAHLLEAMRKRHVYASEDKNLRVIFRVNGHLCGDRIKAPQLNTELKIEFTLVDDDEESASYEIEVYSDKVGGTKVAEKIDIVSWTGNTKNGQTGEIEDIRYTGGFQYIFFRVVQIGEDGEKERAWTAPIWLEPETGVLAAIAESGDVTKFVASKRSRVYHVSGECRDAKRIKELNRVFGEAAMRGRRLHRNCPRR